MTDLKEFLLWMWGGLVFALAGLNAEAAAGAVFGGMFVWALSAKMQLFTRFWISLASIGLGYGLALPVVKADNGWAWFVAGFGASLIHVVIVATRSMVETGSPLPPWFKDILASVPVPWRKRSGDDLP